MGEVKPVLGNDDENEGEWVCDSGADYHMCGDITLFEHLENVPANFFVKQIKGKVAVEQWGIVCLSTNKSNGEKGVLELHEVLYMPGMRVNIFSLQRIRNKGACSYAFGGELLLHRNW